MQLMLLVLCGHTCEPLSDCADVTYADIMCSGGRGHRESRERGRSGGNRRKKWEVVREVAILHDTITRILYGQLLNYYY